MEGIIKCPRSTPPCLLSDPTNPHKLCRRYDPPLSICFACKGQHIKEKRYYYNCTTCNLEFHRGCNYYLPEIKHPFHLIHPLTLTSSSSNSDFQSSSVPINWDSSSSHSDFSDSSVDSIADEDQVKCKNCQRYLFDSNMFFLDVEPYYHCSVCNFSLHLSCTVNSPPLTIENLKLHPHSLTLFPRRVPLPCDACGFSLDAKLDHVYSCLLCNFMVHRSCIYLPRVMKITRHSHRLSHTPSVFPRGYELACGVCHIDVDINYGQYHCTKGCYYSVHSKCATKDEVWDGIDLEGVPEEEEEILKPFVRIDENTIQHFSHEHHYLKINRSDSGNHENKFCQACILPLTVSDNYFSCIQCEFVLHERCSYLPRKTAHPIHKHSLTLFHPFSPNPYELGIEVNKGFFACDGCCRGSCGFMYKCMETNCDFQLDTKCGSLDDLTIHDCHPRDHPFFFSLTRGKCMGCKHPCSPKCQECINCESYLGLKCATLPGVAHYKHDKHPLTLCSGEEGTMDLQYWCEICETKLDATEWFYTCNIL